VDKRTTGGERVVTKWCMGESASEQVKAIFILDATVVKKNENASPTIKEMGFSV